jgi:dihydrofolate reductase
MAGPEGQMDWIKVDDEMFDFVGTFTDRADTAIYGRVTYQLMDNYWPTAADKPHATKHDIEHSLWYNKVNKIVLSKTMQSKGENKTRFISENIPEEISNLKQLPGSNILIFGSPAAGHFLMEHRLIDEYWFFVNPIIQGQGISLFAGFKDQINLKLLETKVFACGVTALHYLLEK